MSCYHFVILLYYNRRNHFEYVEVNLSFWVILAAQAILWQHLPGHKGQWSELKQKVRKLFENLLNKLTKLTEKGV